MWLESPTNPALEVADIRDDHQGRARGRRLRRRRQHLRHAAAAAPARGRRRPGGALRDEVPRRPLRRADGRGRHPRRRALRRAQGPSRPRRRHPGTFEAWLALRGLRTLRAAASSAPSPTPQELVRRLAEHPARRRGPLPGLRRDRRHRARPGRTGRRPRSAARRGSGSTPPRSAASSRRLERRRRWKAEPATIPEGLVRLSVGIEDVEDLWEDLARPWTAAWADWSGRHEDRRRTGFGRQGAGYASPWCDEERPGLSPDLAAIGSDPDAFEAFYREHLPWVRRSSPAASTTRTPPPT